MVARMTRPGLLILLLVVGVGCAQKKSVPTVMPTVAPTLTPTPSPQQHLENAALAMGETTTVQYALSREGAPLVLDSSLGAIFISATGEYQAPDRVHATVKTDISGNIVALDFLWLPEGIYMTNPLTGQYIEQPLEIPLNPAALFDAKTGLSRILITKIEDPEFIAYEELNGLETIHLTGTTDAETVTIIAPIEVTGTFALDLWLDAATSQVIRIQITEDNGDITALEFFDFGQPVDIPSPG